MPKDTPTNLARRSSTAVASLLIGLFALTACGTADNPTSSSGGSIAAESPSKTKLANYSAEVTKWPTIQPVKGGVAAQADKTVWYVPIGAAAATLNAYGVAVKEALSKVGMKFHQCDGKFVPTAVSACLDQAAAQGADAVITGYVDYQLVPNSFDALVNKNIPVLLAGAAPSGGKTDSPKLAFFDTAQTDQLLQRLAAQTIIANSKGKAHVLFIGASDSPATKGMTQAAKDEYNKACPKCTFTVIQYAAAAIDKLPTEVSSALLSHPDINYIQPAFDATVPNTIAGVHSAGYADKVKIASISGALDGVQRISDGDIQFSDAGISTVYAGWMFVDSIVRMLNGGVPEYKGNYGVIRVFDTNNVKGLDLTPGAFEGGEWYGPEGFKDLFVTAWTGK
jgi:ABC-type sugar transport system substrate-binding protein